MRNEENEKESMRSLKSTSDQVLCFCILVRCCFHFVRVYHFLRIPSTHPGKGSCVPLPRLLTRRRPINSSSSGSDELDCCFFFFFLMRFLKIYEQPFIFQHYCPIPGPIRPLATHIRSINNGLTGHMLQQLLFNYITNERSHTLTGRHFSSLQAISCGQQLLEQKPSKCER